MNDKVIDFTIGADPEFACVTSSGRTVTATDYIDEYNENTEFGSDGNGVTFEIRPRYSQNPLVVVNNIHKIFMDYILKQPIFLKFKWISGSWCNGYPLGGHIHFGTETRLRDAEMYKIINKLDHYVGSLSLLLEVKKDGINRRRDGYGAMGDMRHQDWGFEYRPMSSWISSPHVAAAMLCLAKTVVYESLNNSEFVWGEYVKEEDFPNMNQESIFEKFPRIWNDITRMHLYQVYKPYIDLIYFLVKNRLTWLPSTNMKDSWGILDIRATKYTKINPDILWHRYNLELKSQ